MKQYMMRYEIKNKAKDKLMGKYSILIIFAFPYITSVMAAAFTGAGLNTSAFRFYQAGTFVTQILSGFLRFGIAYLCLNIVCGNTYSYKDVFFGFRRENLLKTLILSAASVLTDTICLTPWQYFAASYLETRDTLQLVITVLALIIGVCIYIPVGLALNLTYYLLLDFPEKGATEIIKDSFRVIKGHGMRFFLLQYRLPMAESLYVHDFCSVLSGFDESEGNKCLK